MKLKTPFYKLLLVSIWAILGLSSKAQTYELHVTNEQQIDSKTYQFDIYLLRTGQTTLQLSSIQFGLGYDVAVLNGGTPAFSYVSGSTQLQGTQATFTTQTGGVSFPISGVTYRYMNQSIAASPGAGNGTIISSSRTGCSVVGTRIGTYRLTSTNDFAAGSTMKHHFSTSAASQRTNTLVSAYIGTSPTSITAAASNMGYQSSGTCIQNIALNACALVSSPSHTNVLCNGASTATASANVTGNTVAVSYTISGTPSVTNTTGASTGVFTGLPAGTYVISYTSGSCSGNTGNIVITQPTLLKINEQHTTVSCPGGTSTVTIGGEGGTPAYSYSNGTTTNSTGIFTQTGGTTVAYTVTDANGCTASASTTVSNGVDVTAPVISTCASDQTVSAGGTGSAVIPSFTSGVSATDNCSSVTVTQSPAAGGTRTPGTYTITLTATDASNNSSTCTATLTVTSGCALSSSPSFTNVSCAGGSNGTASANVTGNTQSVSYTISGPTNTTGASTGTFTGLTAGTYVISYTSGACSGNTGNIVVGTTADVTAPVISTCASNQTVSAGGTGSAVIPDFTSGVSATDNCSSVTVTQSPAAGGTRTPGTYTITLTATDASNNSSTCTTTLTVTSGCALSSSPSFTNVSCAGGSNGTASANVTGNTQSVSYTISGPTNTTGASTGTFTGLTAGTYVISYTSGACSGNTGNIVVGTTTDVTAPVISTCASNQTVSAGGTGSAVIPDFTGGVSATDNCSSVTVTQSPAAGGTRTPGTYTITLTATDASNNSSTCTATLTVTSGCGLSSSPSFTNVSCAGGSNGTASANVTGNTQSVSYTISGPTNTTGASTGTFTGLTAGTYVISYTSGACSGNTGNIVVGTTTDVTAPVISTCASNQTITAASNGTAVVPDFTSGVSASDNCSSVTITQSPLAGSAVGVGSQTITLTATDASSNTATCQALLVVESGCNFTVADTITGTHNVCSFWGPGSGTYSISTTSASNYVWSVSTPSTMSIVAGNGTSTIQVHVTPAFTTGTISVTVSSECGLDITRTTTIFKSIPAVPTVSGPVSVCPYLASEAVYSVNPVAGASTYRWTIPATMTMASANADSSVIHVTFNAGIETAAAAARTLKVKAISGCGNSADRSFVVVAQKPATPASIVIQVINKVTCGAKLYRYIAPVLPAATTIVSPATGYIWSFTGTLGANATLDSGTLNSRIIVVRYTNNAAAAIGDSVKVVYTSDCGNSNAKALKLNNTLLGAPLAPASILKTAIQTNVCGARLYRYAAPALPAATTTAMAATGYVWSFTGTLGANATIDSGSVSSRIIVVRYTSNAAAVTGDSVKVYYTSACGNGKVKAAKLSNLALNVPLAPAAVTQQVVANNCGARVYRYIAPALPAATAANGAATGYEWSLPTGPVGSTGTLDSGTVNSRIIRIVYTSNAAAAAGDSIRVAYQSDCGLGKVKAVKLSNLVLTVPVAPAAITQTLVVNDCGARVYRYIAPALPVAVGTAAAATGYQWTLPEGPVGSTGTLDSGTVNSRIIRVIYTSNAAASAGDTIRIAYQSACGMSKVKAIKLSNTARTGCPPPPPPSKTATPAITKVVTAIKPVIAEVTMGANVFPNPSTTSFKLQVTTTGKEQIHVRIMDVMGRMYKMATMMPGEMLNFGSDLKTGTYKVEIMQGSQRVTQQIIKL